MSLLGLAPAALMKLQQAYRRNWTEFSHAPSSVPAGARQWDYCVLTASNAHQAEAYEIQLQDRREAGLLPTRTQFRVYADPDGRRIGSGGATLRALSLLARELRSLYGALNPFAGKRILIIHSGGDSRRLPHCSAMGKLFARVPHELPDGRASSLFDEFLVSLSGLPRRVPEGVLIASGDVLLLFDQAQLNFTEPGAIGVAIRTPAETGTHHGIYVNARDSRLVRAFLHKPSLEVLHQAKVMDSQGFVPVDSGLVWLDRSCTLRALSLAEMLLASIERGVAINLYADLLAPMAEMTTLDGYLGDASEGAPSDELVEVRRLLWDLLRGISFSVETLDPAAFIHFGTTREYLQAMRLTIELFGDCGWDAFSASWHASTLTFRGDAARPIAINTYLQTGDASDACVLDSQIEADLALQPDVLLSHVVSHRGSLAIERGLALDQLPLDGGGNYVTRVWGVDDDPKTAFSNGATVLNQSWERWLARHKISPSQLWPVDSIPSEWTLERAALPSLCRPGAELGDGALAAERCRVQ